MPDMIPARYYLDVVTDCDSYALPTVSPGSGRTVMAEDIFGSGSQLVSSVHGQLPPREIDLHLLVDNWVYELFIFGLVIFFCYLFYFYRSSMVRLVKEGFREKIFEENAMVFRRFLSYCMIMGMMLLSVMAVKFIDYFDVMPQLPEIIPPWAFLLACPAVMAVLVLLRYYRVFIGKVMGGVAMNASFFEKYNFLSRISFAIFTILLTPLMLIFSMALGPGYRFFAWILLIISALSYIIFLVRSFIYFRRNKVSVLQWFLYLCAVEFFPVSLVIILGMRFA